MSLSVSQLTSSTHRPMTMVFASSRCFNEPGLSPTLTTANREDPNPGPAIGTANTTLFSSFIRSTHSP